MDPWYYLDIKTTTQDKTGVILDLHELDSGPSCDGSWSLDIENADCTEGFIIFQGNEYKSITYNNCTKTLTCIGELKTNPKAFDEFVLNLIRKPQLTSSHI